MPHQKILESIHSSLNRLAYSDTNKLAPQHDPLLSWDMLFCFHLSNGSWDSTCEYERPSPMSFFHKSTMKMKKASQTHFCMKNSIYLFGKFFSVLIVLIDQWTRPVSMNDQAKCYFHIVIPKCHSLDLLLFGTIFFGFYLSKGSYTSSCEYEGPSPSWFFHKSTFNLEKEHESRFCMGNCV